MAKNKLLKQIVQDQGPGLRLVNKVPAAIKAAGLTDKQFSGHMQVFGSSPDTAYRLARGVDTQFTTDILRKAAIVLGCQSISQLIDFQ
jgi:hypothetical protein